MQVTPAGEPPDEGGLFVSLFNLLTEKEIFWQSTLTPVERLKLGVYSPVQLLIWKSAEERKEGAVKQYPFIFDVGAGFCELILRGFRDIESVRNVGEFDEKEIDQYRRLLQSLFTLREMREEGNALSLEVHVPLRDQAPGMDIRRLSQVFGRGVGFTRDVGLSNIESPQGNPFDVFVKHSGAPLAALYQLSSQYAHIVEQDLALILDRRGHVVLAAKSNPLLEFYDGGWHCVDLQAGKAAVSLLVEKCFGKKAELGVADPLTALAYHMATHGHGGILAVLDPKKAKGSLQTATTEAKMMTKRIKEIMKERTKSVSLQRASEKGLGRLLLTSAIQDGAVLFSPKGDFEAAGVLVAASKKVEQEGGARRKAAITLGQFGVAIAISQDGAIRLFSKALGSSETARKGLRIH